MTVLLLPGWGTSTQRLEPLRRALVEAGVDARHHAYDAVGSVRGIADALARRVERDRVTHLVGHSLGGLVAASAVLDHGAAVGSVTTVNTPWRGTWAAWTAAPGDPLGQQLRWGSDELARLRGALAEHLDRGHGPRWRVLSAAVDLAAPVTTALRAASGERLDTVLVPTSGHSLSLRKPPMIDAVVDAVVT